MAIECFACQALGVEFDERGVMWMDEITTAFLEAADTFSALLERPEVAARWADPSTMEGYTVGDLAGHVTAATAPVESALNQPAPSELKVIRLGRYYAGMRIGTPEDLQKPIHGAMRDLSQAAARKGAQATADRFRSLVERLGKQLLAEEEADRLLDLRPVVPIAVRLDDFLRTRVVEVVVHTDDLATSVGVDPPQPSPAAATVAIDTLMTTARAAHGDLSVLRALARGERSDADVFPVF